jgi:hypothetical protein
MLDIDPVALTRFCEDLMVSTVRISVLPVALELKVYEFAVREAMQLLYDGVMKHDGRGVIGHHLQLHLTATLATRAVPHAPVQLGNVAAFAKAVLSGNELLHKHLKWMPHALKLEFVEGVAVLLLTALTVVLASVECDVLGHRISVAVTPSGAFTPRDTCNDKHGAVDGACVRSFVEEVLSKRPPASPWPGLEPVEKSLLCAAAAVAVAVVNDTLASFRVRLVGADITAQLVPAPATPPDTADGTVPMVARCREVGREAYLRALAATRRALLRDVAVIDTALAAYRRPSFSLSSLLPFFSYFHRRPAAPAQHVLVGSVKQSHPPAQAQAPEPSPGTSTKRTSTALLSGAAAAAARMRRSAGKRVSALVRTCKQATTAARSGGRRTGTKETGQLADAGTGADSDS